MRTWGELWHALPVELRLDIWRCSVNSPQVHCIRSRWNDDEMVDLLSDKRLRESTRPYRSVAAACTQAREAIQGCLPDRILLEGGIVLRFNGDRDMICLVELKSWQAHYIIPLTDGILSMALVSHIGIQEPEFNRKFNPDTGPWSPDQLLMQSFLRYRNTKTLSVVTLKDTGDLSNIIFAGKWVSEEGSFLSAHDQTQDGGHMVRVDTELEDDVDGPESCDETGDDAGLGRDEDWRGTFTVSRDCWAGPIFDGVRVAEEKLRDCYMKDVLDVVWWRVDWRELQQATLASAWDHLLELTTAWNSRAPERSQPPKRCRVCRRLRSFCSCSR
jgi:hypothetical protein